MAIELRYGGYGETVSIMYVYRYEDIENLWQWEFQDPTDGGT